MLKVMRESFQHLKWILVFVVAVFVLFVFVDWGAGGAGQTGAVESYAARVNGETISLRDFNRALYFTEQRYQQLYGQQLTPEIREQLGLPRQVLNSMVEERLLLQEAKRLKLTATPEEVRQKILEIEVLSPNGKFVGTELYQRYVTTALGYSSAAEFESELMNQVTLAKLESALRNSIALPNSVVEAEYRRREENSKIRYVIFPAERFVAGVAVTPAEVDQYYRANTTRYAHPEQRKVNYLLADTATIRSQMNVTDAELQAQYEKTKDVYKTGESVRAQHILLRVETGAPAEQEAAAKAKADALVAQLRAGADFGTVAKANSDDPGSAANNGDLGFFTRGQMVPEFENAAFTQAIGQVGDPVKSQFGYHIIKTLEKRGEGFRPFAEVKEELRARTIDERARTQARDKIAQLRARLEQGGRSEEAMRGMADAVVSYNTTPFFGKNDQVEGLGRVPQLNAWAFSAKAGDVGAIIDTQRGPIVPYLKETRGAGVAPLAEIRARVEADAKREKARKVAADQLTAAMRSATTVDQLAAQGGTAMEATITRDGMVTGLSGEVSTLVNAALTSAPGKINGPVQVEQGAVAFQVVEQKKFDPASFAKEKGTLVESMRQNEVLRLRSSLLDRMRREADVEVNESLVGAEQTAPIG
jgi:peptidyl-prolyl cis-trans isomerase D